MPSIVQLESLLEASPEDPFLLYALAQEHAKAAGQAGSGHERAIEYYDRCLAADQAYCYAYFHKARSLEALGQLEEAQQVLRTGMDVARTAGDAHALAEISGYLDEISP